MQARFAEGAVTVHGRSREYRRKSDDGHVVTRHFCPSCGATVHYRNDSLPGMIGIPVGAFANAAFPPPTVPVYTECRHPWVELPEDIVENE